MVKEAKGPSRGSTPAIMENALASGISARATTNPARTTTSSSRGCLRVLRTDWRSSGVRAVLRLAGYRETAAAQREKMLRNLSGADEFIATLKKY